MQKVVLLEDIGSTVCYFSTVAAQRLPPMKIANKAQQMHGRTKDFNETIHEADWEKMRTPRSLRRCYRGAY